MFFPLQQGAFIKYQAFLQKFCQVSSYNISELDRQGYVGWIILEKLRSLAEKFLFNA